MTLVLALSEASLTTEKLLKLKEEGGSLIGTHSGTFHTDEIIATWLLKLLQEYRNAVIIRSRRDEMLDLCDILVDVGGSFSVDKKRFDHHQRNFSETWSADQKLTNLSSAGLVWKYFGRRLLEEVWRVSDASVSEELYQDIYNFIFESVDCNDNGVRTCKATTQAYIGGMPSLGNSVADENTSWCIESKMDENKCFLEAFHIVATELKQILDLIVKEWPQAKTEITQAIRDRYTFHPSGRVIHVPRFAQWRRYVPRLDPGESDERIAFVIWKEDGEWHMASQPVQLNSTVHHDMSRSKISTDGIDLQDIIVWTPRRVIARSSATLLKLTSLYFALSKKAEAEM